MNRAGFGWRKGKKKGEQPLSNPRIVSFTLDAKFDEFVAQTELELPAELQKLSCYSAKRSERQGSPCMWYPYPSQKPARSVDMNSMPRSHFALFQK